MTTNSDLIDALANDRCPECSSRIYSDYGTRSFYCSNWVECRWAYTVEEQEMPHGS
jgi:ssDNA-binding Zn-finger/Zn-ribbon topoisomerase 1